MASGLLAQFGMKLYGLVAVAFLFASPQARADERLALDNGELGSLAGMYLADSGMVLEFDARVSADGSLDVVVTHDFEEIAGAMTSASSKVKTLAGVRIEEALADPRLEQRVKQVLESPLWDAYRELVSVLRQKIGREHASHAKVVLLLADLVESGDRFRAGGYRAALARIPTK